MKYQDRIKNASAAAKDLINVSDIRINDALSEIADALIAAKDDVLAANRDDCSKMNPSDPKYDRLRLTPERIDGMAGDMKQVASLPSPLGKMLSRTVRPNGMCIRKISVPVGVIGIVYEARPNVTADVFALCLKSGNTSLLKGGSDADGSNRALVAIIHQTLAKHGINPDVCTLLPP